MAPQSRAAMQQHAETLDDAQTRELLELCTERAHLRKSSGRAKAEEQCDGGGEEHGVATSAAKVNRCSGDKIATTYACVAASSLTSHPSLAHFVSGIVELRAERTHLRNISNCAKAEEECDGEIKEYEVATAAAKVHRCSGEKLATTYACNATAVLTPHPTSAVLTPVSILRTNKTVFPLYALVVSDTHCELSKACEAHERVLSWETSPRAWLANVRAIEMYNGLIPVPESSGMPVNGLRGARLNELLELRAEKKMSSVNVSVTTPLEGSSDDGISKILHQPSSIHLIPAGTAFVDYPLGLGIRSLPHNDSVAYVRAGRCLIQPAATADLSSQNPKFYAFLKKMPDRILGGVLDSGAQRGVHIQRPRRLKTGFFSQATNPVLSLEFMMDTSLLIVAQLELVMINVPSASKLAPSLTFEQLVCHQDDAFVICVTPQDVTPILLLSEHHLYSWSESVFKVEFPMKNARVKPVI